MSNVEISEMDKLKRKDSDDNEIGESYEDRGYSKIPLGQINLNTEPIDISNEFTHSLFGDNIKSYIKVFLGFVIFVILLIIIAILSGHFHYEKLETNVHNENKNVHEREEVKSAIPSTKQPEISSQNNNTNPNVNQTLKI